MSEAEDKSKRGAQQTQPLLRVRKPSGARRLLIATIGAATVNYATGCDDIMGSSVANLLAPPLMPTALGPIDNLPPTAGTGATGAAGASPASLDLDAGAPDSDPSSHP